MSGDVAITSISGKILADTDDMREAALLFDRAAGAVQDALWEFYDVDRSVAGLWGIAARGPSIELPPIPAIVDRAEGLAGQLRSAADRYDDADWMFPGLSNVSSLLDGLGGLAVSIGSLFPGVGDPRIDPRTAKLARFLRMLLGSSALPMLNLDGAPDGSAKLEYRGVDQRAGASTPPRSVSDLVNAIAARDDQEGGSVDVRILVDEFGQRSVIVDIPGTSTWDPAPGPEITDLTTNILGINGLPTSYAQGVLDALRAAGVGSDEPILLVGHSQGGMIAAEITRELARTGEFAVTDALTLGAPYAATLPSMPFDPSVNVLALENTADVVPLLDTYDNPDKPGLMTVQFDTGTTDPLEAHDLRDSYLPGAQAIDASADPALLLAVQRLAPFLSATSATTYQYRVTRERK